MRLPWIFPLEKVVAAPTTGTQGAAVIGGSRRSRNVRARIAAVQRARARATQEDGEEDDDEGEGEGDMEEGLEELDQPKFTGKIGTKKLRKIQEKAEKKAMREVGGSHNSSQLLVIVCVCFFWYTGRK